MRFGSVSRFWAGGSRRSIWLLSAPLLLACAGCGSQESVSHLPVFPAKGRVTLDGLPLGGAYVVLHPKDAATKGVKDVAQAHARSAPDGSFTLTTFATDDGAPAGEYAVTVVLNPVVKQGADYAAGPNVLPPKFARPETTPVKVRIDTADNELPPIQLTK